MRSPSVRRSHDMKAISNRIDRYGEYVVTPVHVEIPCEHCHKKKKQMKDGLCSTCRRVLGLMHAS